MVGTAVTSVSRRPHRGSSGSRWRRALAGCRQAICSKRTHALRSTRLLPGNERDTLGREPEPRSLPGRQAATRPSTALGCCHANAGAGVTSGSGRPWARAAWEVRATRRRQPGQSGTHRRPRVAAGPERSGKRRANRACLSQRVAKQQPCQRDPDRRDACAPRRQPLTTALIFSRSPELTIELATPRSRRSLAPSHCFATNPIVGFMTAGVIAPATEHTSAVPCSWRDARRTSSTEPRPAFVLARVCGEDRRSGGQFRRRSHAEPAPLS